MNAIISLDPPQIIQNDGNPVHPSRLKYDNCNLELLNNANIPNTKQIIDHGKKMNRSRVDFFLTTPNCLSVLHDVYYLPLSSSLSTTNLSLCLCVNLREYGHQELISAY